MKKPTKIPQFILTPEVSIFVHKDTVVFGSHNKFFETKAEIKETLGAWDLLPTIEILHRGEEVKPTTKTKAVEFSMGLAGEYHKRYIFDHEDARVVEESKAQPADLILIEGEILMVISFEGDFVKTMNLAYGSEIAIPASLLVEEGSAVVLRMKHV